MKYILFYFVVALSLQACVSKPPIIEPTPEAAEAALANANYEISLKLFVEFQAKHRSSKFFMAARLGEAQSLEGLESWSEALEIYRSIHDATVLLQPKIATFALYRMSFCYEALGDDVKAVATLRDSLNRKKYLSDEVSQAEAPARLAMLYSKSENPEEANRYIEVAQKGLNGLQGRRDISPLVLAKACFQMGSISHNQISSENFLQAVAGQKAVQRYLLKSINLNVAPWSGQSAEKLKKNYRDIWNTLIEMPGVEGVDAEALTRKNQELQTIFSGEYLDLIDDAELYIPFEDKKRNNLEKDVFEYLAEMKKRTQTLLYQLPGKMGLTSESEKLNSIKRPGKLKGVLPSSKNKTAEDPNL
jgi:tetratricopeptide (TPR) repeat protein